MAENKPFIPKGFKFEGPNGQGYEISRDVYRHEPVKAEQFTAYGGAPEAIQNHTMPDWLASLITEYHSKQS